MLPEVENPIPETIGLATVFEVAAAGGMIGLVVATVLQLPNRERWAANGAVLLFGLALFAYFILLLAQLS